MHILFWILAPLSVAGTILKTRTLDQYKSQDSQPLLGPQLALTKDGETQVTLSSQVIQPTEPESDEIDALYLRGILSTTQSRFFTLWLGTWPDAIDWTAAVMQTHVSAMLTSISQAFNYTAHEPLNAFQQSIENDINRFFSQTTAFYFGQDAFGIRQQAHDDMLWVVLGWLEATRFADTHDRLHHNRTSDTGAGGYSWHGLQFTPTLAHRAHVFYDIVHRAWDEGLCGGGLTWDPQLEPYKNTITNTLFISAAVQMYMYHPGDSNKSPFVAKAASMDAGIMEDFSEDAYWGLPTLDAHDPQLLKRAVQAYDWLQAVSLRNADGLYVDGYHISRGNKRNHSSTPSQCDVRNEMVYTYNQGVILSGLRSLWEATGNTTYLVDGHKLVSSVIKATGWNDAEDSISFDEAEKTSRADVLAALDSSILSADAATTKQRTTWHTLGRAGIMQEFCDAAGSCSQDAQTFKGIFFHHLTHFCTPLLTTRSDFSYIPNISHLASSTTARLHLNSCRQYGPWVARNARAALGTRDHRGVMGGWWGVDAYRDRHGRVEDQRLPQGAVDIWNDGVPFDDTWRRKWRHLGRSGGQPEWEPTWRDWRRDPVMKRREARSAETQDKDGRDQNDRGRGRTVESHASGMAVVRCMWALLQLFD